MEVEFESAKDEQVFKDDKKLVQEYGCEMGKRIRRRLDDLVAAPHLADMYTLFGGRIHQHSETKPERWSLDLVHPYRLLFKPTEPVPRLSDGGVDRTRVTAVTIIGIQDPHGNNKKRI